MKSLLLTLMLASGFLSAAVGQEAVSTPNPPVPAGCTADTTPESPAESALYVEDFGTSLKRYREMVKADPKSLRAKAGVVRALLGDEKLDDGLAEAKMLVQQNPSSAIAYTVLGEAYIRRGEMELVAGPLAKALQLDKCYGRAHYMEGRLLLLSGLRASATRQFTTARALSPNDDQIHVAWMWSLPPKERFSSLKKYMDTTEYLNKDDLEDMRAAVLEGEAKMNSPCTVNAPIGGTTTKFHTGAQHGNDPGILSIDSRINGHEERLRFSSIHSGLTIDAPTAIKLGLKPVAKFTYDNIYVGNARSAVMNLGGNTDDVLSSGGRTRYYATKLDSIKIGDVEFKNCVVRVVDEPADMPDYSNTAATGTIGLGFFSDFLVRVDMPAEKMTLTPLPGPTPERDDRGLPTWSNVGASPNKDVPSMNGGEWGQYNRTIAAHMREWTPYFRFRDDILFATKVGAGQDRLFLFNTEALNSRLAASASGTADKLETVMHGNAPFKGYFMLYGGLLERRDAWTAIRFDRPSRKINVEISGMISQSGLRQVPFTFDLRDNLAQFEKHK